MRIVVIGSGGVGGYFGAKLARAGEDVIFLARGAHLAAIRTAGLVIRSALEGEWRVAAKATDTLAGAARADLALVCVKSFDTEDAAALLRPVTGPETAVLSLQNGVDNEEKLARLLGAGEVLGGAAYIFANIAAPGVIAHHQLGRIVFGAMRGGRSERIDAVAQAFARAGIPFEIASDIRKTLWEKYLALTPLAGVTALTRLPVKFLREVAETRRLWEMQLDELLALARAEGVGLDAGATARATAFIEALAPANYSSLYQDLVQGKRLELEALHGHAVALGRRHGVPTPALFAVYAALKPYAMGAPSLAGF